MAIFLAIIFGYEKNSYQEFRSDFVRLLHLCCGSDTNIDGLINELKTEFERRLLFFFETSQKLTNFVQILGKHARINMNFHCIKLKKKFAEFFDKF